MQIDVTSHSKFRAPGRAGDDVPLVVPGIVTGVFDGATDARGTIVDGVGAGRFAALTVAAATAELFADARMRRLPGPEIVARLAAALAARTAPFGLEIPPSTTLAFVVDCGADWRFLTLGDSGIRLNGSEVLCRTKIIDTVSTHARVALFRHLSRTITDPDALELATRRAIFLGLDTAVAEGIVPPTLAVDIVARAAQAAGLGAQIDIVGTFLRGGIALQHRFANRCDSALCFDTMNGGVPRLDQMIDTMRSKDGIASIELFTDGYVKQPTGTTVADWEAAFVAAETEDFHKIGRFATVKGSTSAEVFDDRTIVILSSLS